MPPARLRPPARHRRPAPRHRRRDRRGPVAVGLVAVLMVATGAAVTASAPPPPADQPSVVAARIPATANGRSGPAGAWERPARRDVPERSAATLATGRVWANFTFDGGRSTLVDTAGNNPLRELTAAGGRLEFVAHGTGRAVKYPPRCATPSSPRCPRAILEGATELNPGTRPIRYGASVLIGPTETAAGSNVLQKGYSVGGTTQFKLQIDGAAGRPSCVLASTTRVYRVTAAVGVADRKWHRLGCARSGARLSITVDGVARGTVAVPATLSIVNNHPLRIGGKNVAPNNDQFAGQIDDAFVAID